MLPRRHGERPERHFCGIGQRFRIDRSAAGVEANGDRNALRPMRIKRMLLLQLDARGWRHLRPPDRLRPPTGELVRLECRIERRQRICRADGLATGVSAVRDRREHTLARIKCHVILHGFPCRQWTRIRIIDRPGVRQGPGLRLVASFPALRPVLDVCREPVLGRSKGVSPPHYWLSFAFASSPSSSSPEDPQTARTDRPKSRGLL